MRHAVDGRKFGRNTSHRVAMLKNLANAVIEKEQIITTVEKAKEARRVVDRLITLAKKGTLHSRRLAFDRTRSDLVVKKLFDELAKRYAQRAGGYTRVLKTSDRRRGDAAEMAILELVDHPMIDRKRKVKAGASAETDAKTTEATNAAQDPFNKLRKVFGVKTKATKGGVAGKANQPKGGTRKTMAGTSGNKSGGGSSS